MDIIMSYLESMFSQMPDTAEVRRAKVELASMMEDKYTELRSMGKSENEAIGTVIAEFGNIDELMGELGLESAVHTEDLDREKNLDGNSFDKKETMRTVNMEDAKDYLTNMARWAKGIAAGVFLCIMSPAALIIFSSVSERPVADAFGILVLFACIAVAVGLFIMNGIGMSRYEYLKTEVFKLEPGVDKVIGNMKEEMRPVFGRNIAVGVILCVTSVVPIAVVTTILGDGYPRVESLMVVLLLFMVACGVWIFIIQGIQHSCISVLLQEGDFKPSRKKSGDIVERIAGIYWPLVAAIYVSYSFITGNWGHSWIIWPVAGVCFGAISAICHSTEKKDM
ncbi:permease prefix domain 1-containing protein [Ihubacter sp. mB4P-1]|uniref:permease prefix domain 1-containing protein n=1 Tax=Ihubacter sp. mB4P-1 TaxID=3242370 RepID=UPI003C7D60FA